MCEITNENFDLKFQEISHCMSKANYIAIDTEFTGLYIQNNEPSRSDTAEERYKKLKKSIQTFNVIQIGLSAFRYSLEQKT
jgi:poly(A)-specific ribonuclease